MEFLNDRIGVLLKYGKILGSLTKRFFYIDNSGNLYYTNDEMISKKFLEMKNFNDEYLIGLIAPISKKINLSECSVSAIKPYLDDKFNLKGRSNFELFLKTRDYRTILVFSWTEEQITFLRDYFLSLSNINEMNSLNDQFGKYDSTDNYTLKTGRNKNGEKESPNYFCDMSRKNQRVNDNNCLDSEFNMNINTEKNTQKIFEFAEVSSNYHKNNITSGSNDPSINESGNNKSVYENININNIDNKFFSFKNVVKDSQINELKDIPVKEKLDDSESKFLNKQNTTINKLNKDFKTGIDNLNSKLNSDLNHKEEVKYMDDYNSYNSINGNIMNNNNSEAEEIKNKIYKFSMEEKKRVENILDKLNGRFVNQMDWDKPSIKLINPSSSEYDYEETWAQMENGSDYSGHVVNLMPNGEGKEYRKDGIFYTGEFKNGKWHGIGVITDVNLDTFQGEFVNGCICGI